MADEVQTTAAETESAPVETTPVVETAETTEKA